MDYPGESVLPFFISTYSRYGAAVEVAAAVGGLGCTSLTWPVANTAFYVPIAIPWPFPVRRVFWVNGTSVTTTNMDFGIYTADGTRLYSTGSTAEAGVSVPQYITPSPDFILSPGRYYFALACSSTTANRGGMGTTSPVTVTDLRLGGVLQQATALALPATMTPATVTNACYPICGVTRTTTGF